MRTYKNVDVNVLKESSMIKTQYKRVYVDIPIQAHKKLHEDAVKAGVSMKEFLTLLILKRK
jgi:hypothetical protein